MASKNSNINHILLTGLPGVGKTTLICKLCDIFKEKNVATVGFYTKEVRNNSNARIGFDVVTLNGKAGRLARSIESLSTNEVTKHKVGNYSVFINEFESLAVPLLLQPQAINAIIIIDEIGKMEMFSQSFVKAVTDIFQKPNIKIIATIPVARGKPLPFIEKLRCDPANHVITVDRSNRNSLTTEILNILDLK